MINLRHVLVAGVIVAVGYLVADLSLGHQLAELGAQLQHHGGASR